VKSKVGRTLAGIGIGAIAACGGMQNANAGIEFHKRYEHLNTNPIDPVSCPGLFTVEGSAPETGEWYGVAFHEDNYAYTTFEGALSDHTWLLGGTDERPESVPKMLLMSENTNENGHTHEYNTRTGSVTLELEDRHAFSDIADELLAENPNLGRIYVQGQDGEWKTGDDIWPELGTYVNRWSNERQQYIDTFEWTPGDMPAINIRFENTPEASTLALFGVGGLLALGGVYKRKKQLLEESVESHGLDR